MRMQENGMIAHVRAPPSKFTPWVLPASSRSVLPRWSVLVVARLRLLQELLNPRRVGEHQLSQVRSRA